MELFKGRGVLLLKEIVHTLGIVLHNQEEVFNDAVIWVMDIYPPLAVDPTLHGEWI